MCCESQAAFRGHEAAARRSGGPAKGIFSTLFLSFFKAFRSLLRSSFQSADFQQDLFQAMNASEALLESSLDIEPGGFGRTRPRVGACGECSAHHAQWGGAPGLGLKP